MTSARAVAVPVKRIEEDDVVRLPLGGPATDQDRESVLSRHDENSGGNVDCAMAGATIRASGGAPRCTRCSGDCGAEMGNGEAAGRSAIGARSIPSATALDRPASVRAPRVVGADTSHRAVSELSVAEASRAAARALKLCASVYGARLSGRPRSRRAAPPTAGSGRRGTSCTHRTARCRAFCWCHAELMRAALESKRRAHGDRQATSGGRCG